MLMHRFCSRHYITLKHFALSALMSAVLPSICWAQAIDVSQRGKTTAQNTHSDNTLTRLPESEIIVTGVYRAQPQARSTQPVSVLTAKDIDTISPSDTSTLLRNVRGLMVNQQGGMGGINEVSIRGSESNFVSVYVDGVAVNDPVNSRGGSYNFNALSPLAIDKLEVLRGPNSAIYSSGALGGAIHIITLSPSEKAQRTLRLDVGEHGYTNGALKLSGQDGKLGYAVRVGTLDSGSDMMASHYQSDDIAGIATYQLSPNIYTQFNFRYADEERKSFPEQSGGPQYAIDRRLEVGESEEWNGRFLLQVEHRRWWHSQFEATYFNRQSDTSSPGISPYTSVPATKDDTDYRRSHWRWTQTLGEHDNTTQGLAKDNGALWFNLGVDGERESGNSQGHVDFGFAVPTNFELKLDQIGLFANANYQSNTGWLWQVSVRNDNPDSSDTQNSYQAGIRTPALFERLQASLNWGQAYKLPSFFALAHPLVGNDQLKPELAEGWTLDFDWQVLDRLSTQLSLFSNEYQDLVDFDATLFQNVNRSSVKNSGADFSIQWTPHQSTLVSTSANYTDIDVKDNLSKLTGRPQWSATIRLDQEISKLVSAHLNYRWKDQQFATSLHTGLPVTEVLDSYGVVDMNLQWQLSRQISASLNLDNITDEVYQEAVGFSGQGRRARVGIRFDF